MSTTPNLRVVPNDPAPAPEPVAEVPQLTWNDFAPALDPGWSGVDLDDLDAEAQPSYDHSLIYRCTVDGVDYVTDRYLLVRADLAPEGTPGHGQSLLPAGEGTAQSIERLVRAAAAPAVDDHPGLSPFHLLLARRMGWDLEPVGDKFWRATRGGTFVGLVADHAAGVVPDTDMAAIETIYESLGFYAQRITRWGAAATIAKSLTENRAALSALRVVGAAELLELAYRREEVAAQHAQIDAVLQLHKPETAWMATEDSPFGFATRGKAQAEIDRMWADPLLHVVGTAKPEPVEFTYCVECAAVQREVMEGDAVADGGYGSTVEWPCATATALGVTA